MIEKLRELDARLAYTFQQFIDPPPRSYITVGDPEANPGHLLSFNNITS